MTLMKKGLPVQLFGLNFVISPFANVASVCRTDVFEQRQWGKIEGIWRVGMKRKAFLNAR